MQIYRLCILMLTVLMIVVEAHAQLPPDIEADRHLLETERHIVNRDYAAAKTALDRILELQAEYDLALPEAFWFKHAQVSHQAGLHGEAVESVTRYLTTVGREGEHYREALELLDEATARHRLAQLPREMRNSVGMEFVLIPPGTFMMGTPREEVGEGLGYDEHLHRVTLSQPFYLGKYEVTQGQWTAVMGNNPSEFSSCGRTCPVDNVSYDDVQVFIEKLNALEGVETYRLPTEAEWEYAARARTQTVYYFGNAENLLEHYAWCGNPHDTGWRTHPVGRKLPNGFGLYDVFGNVAEWVADWYGLDLRSSVTDPRGPTTGIQRVRRGGYFGSSPWGCRAAARYVGSPDLRSENLGFRLARTS